MKNWFLILTVLILCACGGSDSKKTGSATDNSLEDRLASFVKANDAMNLEQMADHIYPKLFTIVPRTELLKTMKETFDGDEVKVDLDSIKIEKVHPVFETAEGQYAKVNYSMLMRMNFITSQESDTDNKEMLQNILASMAAEYGEENTSLDENGIITIRQKNTMVAAKDQHAKDWSFVELKLNDPMTDKLFSKELLTKLATYN